MTAALEPDPRRARVRIAVGAAVLLVLVGLGAAVLVGALAPGGATTAVGGADGGAGSSNSASGRAGPSESSGGSNEPSDPPSGSAPGSNGSAPGSAGSLYVHVVGQVAAPGLYRLASGARAIDAISAAGGLTASADSAAVNLARPVADGEQLVVPAVGEAPLPTSTWGTSGGASTGSAESPGAIVDLNTADQTALETLPRVGPALAQRILDWRAANGRFSSIEDLRSVSGIGDKTFDGLKDRVKV